MGQETESNNLARAAAWAALPALLALTVFSQSIAFDFVNYDDPAYVYENARVYTGITIENLHWAFTRSHAANWHPLTWISHQLDCTLFGLHPAGHHLGNVLLHAASAFLVTLLLHRATGARWAALVVGCLFAIHPLRAESVAWVSERKDVLSAFFFLLALLAWNRHIMRGCRRAYAAALLCAALALLAKPMAVSLPLVMLAWLFWPADRLNRGNRMRSLVELAPFFAMAGVVALITYRVQSAGGATGYAETLPVAGRLANGIVNLARYPTLMLWPSGLAAHHPFPAGGVSPAAVLTSLAAVAVVCTAALALARSQPWVLSGVVWYLATVLPVVGFVQVGRQAFADRYTYLPSIGLSFALVWTARWLVLRYPNLKRPAAALAIVWIAVLAGLAWRQTGYWRDSFTLWERALAVTGEDNRVAQLNLGVAFLSAGDLADARERFETVLRLSPDDMEGLLHLALAEQRAGHLDEALALFGRATERHPAESRGPTGQGSVLLALGDPAAAETALREALRRNPSHAGTLLNLGIARAMQDDPAGAERHIREAIALDPESADAYYNLALCLGGQGRAAEAEAALRAALRVNPAYEDARSLLDEVSR